MRERVELVFKGLMLERLVSRAAKRGVAFERVKRIKPREARIVTDERGAAELLDMSREYSLDIRRTHSSGAGAVMRRVKSRWTFLAALVLVGCVAASALSRVWVIEINARSGASRAEIAVTLEDMGVKPGMRIREGDARDIQKTLEARCPSLAYAGAKTRGVRLYIEAVGAFPAPDVYDQTVIGDMVAAMDAVVYSIDVLSGTPKVEVGQSVKKGDVLIEGKQRDTRESWTAVNAKGSVIGRAWLTGEAACELIKVETVRTGRVSFASEIRLYDYSRVLRRAEEFARYEEERAVLPIGGIIAPLELARTARYETSERSVARDMEAVRRETLEKAVRNAMNKAPEGAVAVDKWTDATLVGNERVVCRALVEIRLDIAKNTNIDAGG